MKTLIHALTLAIFAGSSLALAASHEHDMSQHQMAAQPATQQGVGILKAINAKDGKVQIAHEPIAALGWPAMTMWFVLHDPLPAVIKVGDGVRFEMMQGDKNQWMIVKIGPKN
jgi:Cu/Ag efflux protein CusF